MQVFLSAEGTRAPYMESLYRPSTKPTAPGCVRFNARGGAQLSSGSQPELKQRSGFGQTGAGDPEVRTGAAAVGRALRVSRAVTVSEHGGRRTEHSGPESGVDRSGLTLWTGAEWSSSGAGVTGFAVVAVGKR